MSLSLFSFLVAQHRRGGAALSGRRLSRAIFVGTAFEFAGAP
jgi:hypothetical protein